MSTGGYLSWSHKHGRREHEMRGNGMRAYLAAPIFNPEQLRVVEHLLNELEEAGFSTFSPYHASQMIWNGRAPKDCSDEERKQVLKGNIEHLHCDLLLAWIGGYPEGFTDPGVVWEMGYCAALSGAPAAYGRLPVINRPIVCGYIDDSDMRQSMNLMLAGTVDAVVKGHTELIHFLSQAKLKHWTEICEKFAPDRHIAHEKEPIV
jgi:Nucleoside 2-deoxyribosyltransferase